jgi:transcriptional regulator with XRE-family HTH domain
MRPQELKQRLARHIRSFRHARGMTQEEVAGQSGIGWRHLQKIEAAEVNITLPTLCRLAATLRVDPSQLLSKAEERG